MFDCIGSALVRVRAIMSLWADVVLAIVERDSMAIVIVVVLLVVVDGVDVLIVLPRPFICRTTMNSHNYYISI